MYINSDNKYKAYGSQYNYQVKDKKYLYIQMHLNYNDSPVQAIDSSLNMLKQLQAKLKNQKNHFMQPYIPTNSQVLNNHGRIRTQPNQFTHRNIQPNTFTLHQNDQSQIRSPQNINKSHTFYHSQPTMIQCNQNDHSSIKSVLKQNRKLKKYVNCLLQMNDYLKNQLVKKDSMKGVNKMGHSFQLELMKMEIQYLKQLNRDKQLQIKKNIHLKQAKKKVNKKSREHAGSTSEASSRRQHYRSCSAYDASDKKRYESYPNIHESQLEDQQNGEISDHISSQRVMKSTQAKKSAKQIIPKKTKQCSSSKKSSKRNTQTQSKIQTKKKKTIREQQLSWKKCRLCYI